MDREAWPAAVRGAAKSRTGLSGFFTFKPMFEFVLYRREYWLLKACKISLSPETLGCGWRSLQRTHLEH